MSAGLPVLAITGMQGTSLLGTGYQQEVHLDRVFEDVAGYNAVAYVPVSLPSLWTTRWDRARSPDVAHLTIPVDLQEADPAQKPYQGGLGTGRTPDTRPVSPTPQVVPSDDELVRAPAVLNEADRVLLLVGQGALGAGEEVVAVAERLAEPVVKSLLGKAVIPDDHPLTTAGLGLLCTRPSEDAMEACDALLMVGTHPPAQLPPRDRLTPSGRKS